MIKPIHITVATCLAFSFCFSALLYAVEKPNVPDGE